MTIMCLMSLRFLSDFRSWESSAALADVIARMNPIQRTAVTTFFSGERTTFAMQTIIVFGLVLSFRP